MHINGERSLLWPPKKKPAESAQRAIVAQVNACCMQLYADSSRDRRATYDYSTTRSTVPQGSTRATLDGKGCHINPATMAPDANS